MDPWLFRKYVKRCSFPLLQILNECYPLKGSWSWDKIDDDIDKEILELFRQIHLSNTPVKIGKGTQHIEEWCVDVEYSHPLYKKLSIFMNGEEDELSSETEKSISSSSEKIIIKKEEKFPIYQRDLTWKDSNPLLNPRLLDDIKSGFLIQPKDVDIIPILKEIQDIDTEWLCADGTGEKENDPKIKIPEFGLYGKEKCLKCAKTIAFIKSIAKEYSLDFEVAEYTLLVDERKNIWEWIQIGNGWYRDFEWMLVGSRDHITKTIRYVSSKPLQKRSKPEKDQFSFNPDKIFTQFDKCLDISTGKMVSRTKETDQYGFISNSTDDKYQIRGYIWSCFKKKYSKTIIPEWPDKKTLKLIKLLSPPTYIDFETCEPIKYSATTSFTHEFSKKGYAKRKELKTWKIKEIDFFLEMYEKS